MAVTIRNAVDADLDPLIKVNAQVQKLHAQVYPAAVTTELLIVDTITT
jgi:hypothetical protein